MGLIQKKDEREVIDGVEVIERSDVPEDLEGSDVELVDGRSYENKNYSVRSSVPAVRTLLVRTDRINRLFPPATHSRLSIFENVRQVF